MNTRRLWVITGIALVVVVALDLVVQYARFPGYGALIGFGGCVVIVVVSKWIGKRLLERPEGYYEHDVAPDVQEDLRGG
ncbi:hypothetical protein [Egicoccus sp. AB-alg6-2]|uniref:hypothetical protein n=1 Tax=Egicoccus sp. AB-alg6-2 TaxID=3242692 RepID=UPI00359E09E3